MFLILLNFGWMVDLAMSIFEFLTKFLFIWHPWHPWVCIRSDLKSLETDIRDSSYCAFITYAWYFMYRNCVELFSEVLKGPISMTCKSGFDIWTWEAIRKSNFCKKKRKTNHFSYQIAKCIWPCFCSTLLFRKCCTYSWLIFKTGF